MALDYEATLDKHIRNKASNANVGAKTTEKKPVANYWLNIGYQTEVDLEDGTTETRFVSLASGIALDTLAELPTNSSNKLYREMQFARNELRDQLIDAAKAMQPGEERIIGSTEVGLQLQLRRVGEAKPEVKTEENPFSRKLALVA